MRSLALGPTTFLSQKQEDTASYDTEYALRKGKCKAVNCIVTPSGGGGKHDSGNDDMYIGGKQLADSEGLRLQNTVSYDTTDVLSTVGGGRTSTLGFM